MSKLALLGGRPVSRKGFTSYNSIGREEQNAAVKVMRGKVLSAFVARAGEHFLGGKYVKGFERMFCNYFNVKYAVSFNSASTALQAAVGALGIGPGDQVITSPFTMSATASAVLFNNALPVFADIDENNFCLDPRSVEINITEKTKAILAVNLSGGTPDYDSIIKIAKKNNLKIIEDNAQAPGATYKGKYTGTIGDIGVFSFNFHKTIQCGEGGVLVTNNKGYALRAQLIRNHGEVVMDDLIGNSQKDEPILGNNFRLTELQAAIAIEQLKKLKKLNEQRIALADYLTGKLKKFSWLVAPQVSREDKHVYYVYSLRFLENIIGVSREVFATAMLAEGFIVNQGYQKPLYLLPIYQNKEIYPNSKFPFVSKDYPQNVVYDKGICPVAERMYEHEYVGVTICQPPKTKKTVDLFVQALKKIEENVEALKNYGK